MGGRCRAYRGGYHGGPDGDISGLLAMVLIGIVAFSITIIGGYPFTMGQFKKVSYLLYSANSRQLIMDA